MKLKTAPVALLLFFSGVCALVYQVAWFRELRLIFGASTSASAAVLAIFMGGLGLGGAYVGRRADASPNPLAVYARLEIAVSIGAGMTPVLVIAANAVYVRSGGTLALGLPVATLLRVVLSVVVLGPVTFLMGGTLPAAARAASHDDDGARRNVATLYGMNTAGAVLGTVLANFLLLEVLGTRLTLWAAALVNVLVGMLALSLSRRFAAAPVTDEPVIEETPSPDGAIPRWAPPAAAALVGASFMLMELSWYRMLGPLLGGSSYTFGLILAVALAGIGVGGGIYARTPIPATLRWFALSCALEALFIVLPYAVGDDLAIFTALLRPLNRASFGATTGVWTLIAAIVVFPAAVVSGAQFPLVIGLYGRGAKGVGRDVGGAYLANTIGATLGSLGGGFGLMPLLGALGVWKLVVGSLVIGSLVAVAVAAREAGAREHPSRTVMRALFALAPLLFLLAPGPSAVWRHSGIGAGRADPKLDGSNASVIAEFRHTEPRSIRWETDGVESAVALNDLNGFTFIVNGKADGNAINDAPTQVLGGLLPALLHGSAHRALVVGLGTGSTAGWLGAIPEMERVDVVELEPAILRVAHDCAPVNQNVLDNAKVHITLADAREQLRTTKERYDIIFSEPSNPYRAGISSLYTVEYYRAAADRIAPGGKFVQWIQAYEIDGWVIATALSTLRQVFGDVEVWRTMDGDLFLVASAQHVPLDLARLRAQIATEPFASALAAVWHTNRVEGLLSHFVARSALADKLIEIHAGAVNTDDQNFLEFAFARNVGSRRRVDEDVVRLAGRLGLNLPDVINGALAPERLQEETWLFQRAEGLRFEPPIAGAPMRGLVPVLLAAEGGLPSAAKLWLDLHREEIASSGEWELVAESAARAGADEAPALLEHVHEVTRAAFRAIYAQRRGDDAAATAALVRLFEQARTYPWVRPVLLEEVIALAVELASRSPQNAHALYGALGQPFAVENARSARTTARARISVRIKDDAACLDAFGALEPPPWQREILTLRLGCYIKGNSPRAAQAELDVAEILRTDPRPLGASIP